MTENTGNEEQHSRMLYNKLRLVATQKFGYGIEENQFSKSMLSGMNSGDAIRMLGNLSAYHLKRFCRGIVPFGLETVNVTIKDGVLKGKKQVSVLGKTYYSFQGIPYAKPPLGPLRFKDPEPVEPWQGVRSALKEGNICLQADVVTRMVRGSENCLFLNVFTPELPQEGVQIDEKAVMVWIHGGGFNLGSGNAEMYAPDFFMGEDVVIVTLNYRLGVLGFLSTGTEDAPGNAGLKDMVLALKWVQGNISAFGGNPNNVTIFGESAGGAAVHFLMLSPLAKGLFHRAISQSGSAFCPWAFNEEPLETAMNLGRAFGLETNDPKVLVEYLKKISAKVLAKKQNAAISLQSKQQNMPFAFLPCVEPAWNPNAFLTEHPLKLLQVQKIHSDVPYITGFNELEGILFLKPIIDRAPAPKEVDEDFERLVPKFLKLTKGSAESIAVADKIREFYFNNKRFDKSTFKEYADVITDTFFFLGASKSTEFQAKFSKSPVYSYKFTFDGEMGLMKKILNVKNIPGPVHADDLGYLFYMPILGPNLDPKSPEMKFSKKMVRLWTNFAKFGNPTPDPEDPVLENLQWKPFLEKERNYLVLGENLTMDKNVNKEREEFWKNISQNVERL